MMPSLRTIVYVDAFNLYFRLLEKRPLLKWLNIKKLAETLLNSTNRIVGVKYYSARVSGRIDTEAPARQQIYLDALGTVPEISIYMGSFLLFEKFAGLVKPPEFRPRLALPEPWPDVVRVIKVEEKGSDVNLACHLLLDAFQGNFDVAAVLSNDSDLVEPIHIVTQILGKPVGLLSPVSNPTLDLRRVSSFIRRISVSDLGNSQFPNPVICADILKSTNRYRGRDLKNAIFKRFADKYVRRSYAGNRGPGMQGLAALNAEVVISLFVPFEQTAAPHPEFHSP